jgi:hypothetical protein
MLEEIDSLEGELAEARAALDEQTTAGQERAEVLGRRNRALRNCATKARPRGRPRVTLIPSFGTPGTRVEVVGFCFKSEFWRTKRPNKGTGIGLWTRLDGAGNPDPDLRKGRCDLVAGRTGTFQIGADGRMRGQFVVPRTGRCTRSKASNSMVPGRYNLIIGCRECAVARFRITTSTSERDRLAACSTGDWRVSLKDPVRTGGVVLVGLGVHSVSGARCRLTGEISVTLVGLDGAPLSIEGNPSEIAVDAVVGEDLAALWAWDNWCGGGSISVRAAIRDKATSEVIGSRPRCNSRSRSSELKLISQLTDDLNP